MALEMESTQGETKSDTGRVMIVEDSESLRALINATLVERGMQVIGAGSLSVARASIFSWKPDVVILDLGLADGEGTELLQAIETVGSRSLVITARDSMDDRLKALSMGADDYLVKPFDLVELYLRVRNMIGSQRKLINNRRIRVADFGGVKIDLITRALVGLDDRPTHTLTEGEFQLFRMFGENSGVLLSRNAISRRVFGRNYLSTSRALDMVVSKLRRKIKATDPRYDISAVKGLGYIFLMKHDETE